MTIYPCKMLRTKIRTLALCASLLLCGTISAQNVSDLIISEVLAEPDSVSLTDGFGQRNGWIEVFNTSQGTVNYGGCFLTCDRNVLNMSPIPKGDLSTKLGPRQSVVFYASGNGDQGTFYVDFKVEKGKTIYLVSNDGRTIIDSLTVPSDLPRGKSVSKAAFDNKEMDFQVMDSPTEPTPGRSFKDLAAETNPQKMARTDPHGFILTIVSVTVVFAALALLWFLFASLFQGGDKKKKKEEAKASALSSATPSESKDEIAAAIAMALSAECGGDGETAAAIAMALESYFCDAIHDRESFVITITPRNTAWAEKSLGFRKTPQRK